MGSGGARTKRTVRASAGNSRVPYLVMESHPAPPVTEKNLEALLTHLETLEASAEARKKAKEAAKASATKKAEKKALAAAMANAKKLARERHQAKMQAARELDHKVGRGDSKISPEAMAYWLGSGHSRVASFPLRFGAIHASFPVMFMSQEWWTMVNGQFKLKGEGMFKTEAQYALFEEYVVWAEDYAKSLK